MVPVQIVGQIVVRIYSVLDHYWTTICYCFNHDVLSNYWKKSLGGTAWHFSFLFQNSPPRRKYTFNTFASKMHEYDLTVWGIDAATIVHGTRGNAAEHLRECLLPPLSILVILGDMILFASPWKIRWMTLRESCFQNALLKEMLGTWIFCLFGARVRCSSSHALNWFKIFSLCWDSDHDRFYFPPPP